MDEYYYGAYRPRKRKRGRFLRLRYVLLAVILIAIGFHFASAGKDKHAASAGKTPADKVAAAPKNAGNTTWRRAIRSVAALPTSSPALTKQDLVHINEDLIKSRNLTIDGELQQFIAAMSARYALYKGAIVVMDARRGDILALYGTSPAGEDCSLALDPELAASIFKLVTATAAMEQRGFTDASSFFYTGNAHTLYKRQLTNKRDRWSADITLADAFARSNNVVFGKLGALYLGEAPIQQAALRLGFGKSPLKEFNAPASVLFNPTDAYGLAELACGFNKATRISPLHAAEMATAPLNAGAMVAPRLTKTAKIERWPVMRADTAAHLQAMMEKTVKAGTATKDFRGASSDRVLRQLVMGGKSGSIDGDDPVGRRNWFVGFARNEQTGEAITIGCALVLNKHFRIKADMLSRLIIRKYFSRQACISQAASPNLG